MLGAIAGDIIGSIYEFHNTDDKDFELFSSENTFTDDTVLTIATAESLLYGTRYQDNYRRYANMYWNRGFGSGFKGWVKSHNPSPYNSYGNGSAMRVSPIGWAFDNMEDILIEAHKSAICSHNHPEGIKGAKAIAAAVFIARTRKNKESIVDYIANMGYDLSKNVDDFERKFDVSCQGTIPRCVAAFRETEDFEGAVRTAIAMGGDADTNACIVGSIAEAYYDGVPRQIKSQVFERIPFQMRHIVEQFKDKYCKNG